MIHSSLPDIVLHELHDLHFFAVHRVVHWSRPGRGRIYQDKCYHLSDKQPATIFDPPLLSIVLTGDELAFASFSQVKARYLLKLSLTLTIVPRYVMIDIEAIS